MSVIQRIIRGKRRLIAALVVAVTAAVLPVVGATAAHALGSGEACVFFAPNGADGLGHVGWGFRIGQQDDWVYGATENPAATLNTSGWAGAWHSQGPMSQMMSNFRTLSYWSADEQGHGAPAQPYYQDFKCLTFPDGSAVTAALNEVSYVESHGYNVVSWNCMTMADAILGAYNVPSSQLPSVVSSVTPAEWFQNLSGDGWASEPVWGTGIPLHGETWVNYNSGQYLDLTGASTAAGAYVEQWPSNGGSSANGRDNQYWVKFPDANDGSEFRIVNTNSDLCMGVQGGSTAAGARVVQWSCNGNADQEWDYSFTGIYDNGWPVFNIVDIGSGDCLGVLSSSTAQGAEVVQWPCNGHTDQMWY